MLGINEDQAAYLRQLADEFFYGLITLAEIKKKVSPKEFDYVMRLSNRHSVPRPTTKLESTVEAIEGKIHSGARGDDALILTGETTDTLQEVKRKIESDPRYQDILDTYMPLIEAHPDKVYVYTQKAFNDFYELYVE